MIKALRLGIDVGGTNTDAVVMAGRTVLTSTKVATTEDIFTGVVEALRVVLDGVEEPATSIRAVMIGTTQFINAFVQRRSVEPVGILRIALPRGDGVPPLSGWPDDVADIAGHHIYMVGGGALYTGRSYAEIDEDAIKRAAADIRHRGIRSVAVSSTFAPLRPDIEVRGEAILRETLGDCYVTRSAQIGGIGLMDRENATIVNAMLAPFAEKVIAAFRTALDALSITAPLFISQNDGTLITETVAAAFPIRTCSAGPTNSIRGAAFLTGEHDGLVIDVGGTTTDIGYLVNGFPRETTQPKYIGGVRTAFRMPDVLSIGVGGGSLVRATRNGWRVGPASVGFRITQQARIFGGAELTATDLAVRSGAARLGDASLVANLPDKMVDSALDNLHFQIEAAVDQMKTSAAALPLILVGGGSIIVSRPLAGTTKVIRPEQAEVANAVGAAIALVGGVVDKLYDFATLGREHGLALARQQALDAAIAAGADPQAVEIVEQTELPMTHLRAGAVQVRVRAVGPLSGLGVTGESNQDA